MSIPGTTVQFGTRFLLSLLARAVAEYLRHKGKIDLDLPEPVSDALLVIADALPSLIETLNAPGPQ